MIRVGGWMGGWDARSARWRVQLSRQFTVLTCMDTGAGYVLGAEGEAPNQAAAMPTAQCT